MKNPLAGATRSGGPGFSLTELMIVVGIILIIIAIALPRINNITESYRLTSDARGIAAQLHLARMRAASDFTRAEVNFNTTGNTYQVEVWSKAANAFVAEGGAQPLSQGDVFGYGALATPAGSQSTIAQTAQIIFNSRGFSVNSSGTVTANSVIYFMNSFGSYGAVAVSVAGEPTAWSYKNGSWVAQW
jgi:prepilin-type N-terminal cleavage/methylation domain-containing protein